MYACQEPTGLADHRLTDYSVIELWWEVVFSAYLLTSLQTLALAAPGSARWRAALQPCTTPGGTRGVARSTCSTTCDYSSSGSAQGACSSLGRLSFLCRASWMNRTCSD